MKIFLWASQPLEEDDGPDSDAADDDAFSQSLDLTSHADNPKYWGVPFLAKINEGSSSRQRHLKETSFVAPTRRRSALEGITASYNKMKTAWSNGAT